MKELTRIEIWMNETRMKLRADAAKNCSCRGPPGLPGRPGKDGEKGERGMWRGEKHTSVKLAVL